jgi:hypothetical protein
VSETFPEPREDDCSYGCCKAGDEGRASEVTKPIAASGAQTRGQDRLIAARGSIRAAFDGLDLGWTYDDVWTYLEGSPAFQALPEDRRPICAGLVMGFAIVAIEQDRAQLRAIVDEQAEDEGLWGVNLDGSQNIVEAYLQQELRRLHTAIEGET